MSLEVNELKKMSIKKLEAFLEGCEGEDKLIVEDVIASKKKSIAAVAVTGEMVPDLEASRKMREQLDLQEAERLAKKAAKEEERVKARMEREELKLKALAEKEEKAKLRADEKNAMIEARELKKAEKLEAMAAKLIEKEALKEAKNKSLAERFAKITGLLAEGEFELKPTKTAVIKQCLSQGLTNKEINEKTGYSMKFICDTVWRIEQQIKAAEFAATYRAKQNV